MSAEHVVLTLLLVSSLVFVLNLPFGYWRANVRKFSFAWFIAVHGPVPIAIMLRIVSGLGFRFSMLPVMVGAFFGGQMLGGRILSRRRTQGKAPVSSCLVWDLLNNK